eukprot:c25509_g1_i1 orf=1-213(-)
MTKESRGSPLIFHNNQPAEVVDTLKHHGLNHHEIVDGKDVYFIYWKQRKWDILHLKIYATKTISINGYVQN